MTGWEALSMALTGETGNVTARTRARQRARDWAEIQERMLVPLYEAVYGRLEVGPATSVLGLGCRSGLALLLAAARGAEVLGTESEEELRALARARQLRVRPAPGADAPGSPERHAVVTAFERLGSCTDPRELLREAAARTARGGHVVLATWGPPERCESASVLRVAQRLGPPGACDPFALSEPGVLESLVRECGLRPDGGGRVACPFAYPDLESALRGLLSTGAFDAAAEYASESLVEKELAEALYPYVREDGSVRMRNVFRYLLAEAVR
jgi:SAM-dependent methyltransferase